LTLQLSDFDFEVPANLIAHQPLAARSASKLLVRQATGEIIHSQVKQLAKQLPQNALLLLNDSKVIPSRILGHFPTGGKWEIMLLQPLGDGTAHSCQWKAIGRPSQKLIARNMVQLGNDFEAAISKSGDEGALLIDLNRSLPDTMEWLQSNAFVPLPPYIERPDPKPASQSSDTARYQTVYAKVAGSVAAPTAGLHLDDSLMKELRTTGIEIMPVTLHVGGGTFLPVKVADLSRHNMHSETYQMPAATYQAIENARNAGRPIFALGTTTFRCVSAFYQDNADGVRAAACDQWRETKLFIHPTNDEARFKSQVFTGLMTNFHQPGSTLFMLLCALIGRQQALATYEEAMRREYRFFSYGDACLFFF